MSNTNALVKLPERPLSTVQGFNDAVAKLHEQANVLLPVQRIDHIPPMHAVSLRVVHVDTNPQKGDTYKGKFCKEGELALKKPALLRLWNNAGGRILKSHRCDDRGEPFRVEWTVSGEITLFDGTVVPHIATKELDLRDGSPEMKTMQAKQLSEARRQIVTLCESKALLRMIRAALAMDQKYSVRDLQKPFVVPTLVFVADTSDPEIKRMVAAKAIGVSADLYGPGRAGGAHQLPPQVEPAASGPPAPVNPAEPLTVDASTGEVIDADPWDPTPSAAAVAKLPITEELLAEIEDGERRNYLRGVNRYWSLVVAAIGQDAAEMDAAKMLEGVDWKTTALEKIGEIGGNLRAWSEKARGGAA